MNLTTWATVDGQKVKIETKKNSFSKDVSSVLSFQKELVEGMYSMDMTKPVKCFHISNPDRISKKELSAIHTAAINEAKTLFSIELV